MFKKILIITGYILLTAAIAAYFVFATIIVKQKYAQTGIKKINITITDSASNQFVNKDMIKAVLKLEGINEKESLLRHINQYDIEQQLKKQYNIKRAQVFTNLRGVLSIKVEQRRPLLRIQGESGGYYLDDEAYIFPLDTIYTANVPVVTGKIPFNLVPDYKGYLKNNKKWADALMDIGEYIAADDFWNSMIEQIDIDEKEMIYLTPRVGEQEIKFGSPDNIDIKFKKLYAFYKDIVPNSGWNKYKRVDLDIDNQIVCKLRNPQIKTKDTTGQNIKNLNI
jgi:cell division protein FtsQ